MGSNSRSTQDTPEKTVRKRATQKARPENSGASPSFGPSQTQLAAEQRMVGIKTPNGTAIRQVPRPCANSVGSTTTRGQSALFARPFRNLHIDTNDVFMEDARPQNERMPKKERPLIDFTDPIAIGKTSINATRHQSGKRPLIRRCEKYQPHLCGNRE